MNWQSVRVGIFLAIRQIRRSSKWTTALVIFIMALTFVNLVIVSGVLVGLIVGASTAFRAQYSADILITAKDTKPYIEESQRIIATARALPWVEGLTARYIESGTIEANYRNKKNQNDLNDQVSTLVTGIDPVVEDSVTNLSRLVVKGEYLRPDDFGEVLVGSFILRQYSTFEVQGIGVLENVDVGSRIRVRVNGVAREVTVKGIVKSKIDEVSRRVYFNENELRNMIDRTDNNVSEIAIRLKDPAFVPDVQRILRYNFDGGLIKTYEEAQGQAFKDIERTMALLANIIGSIGLAIASITTFIIVFINAINRKKYIGILKGVGIAPGAIELAYIIQALFYAVLGSIIGLVFTFGFLKPYFDENPINFPFSDGILVARPDETALRVGLLLLTTIIAGYVPAKLIVSRRTLDAILGRE